MAVAIIFAAMLMVCFVFVVYLVLKSISTSPDKVTKLQKKLYQERQQRLALESEVNKLEGQLKYAEDQLTVYSFQMPSLETRETNGTQE